MIFRIKIGLVSIIVGWSGVICASELPPIRLSPASSLTSFVSEYVPVQRTMDIHTEHWTWQLFPEGLIYPSALAGVHETRLGGVWNHDEDLDWIWDITLGGRAPLIRYGNKSSIFPEGWQLDIEGSVHLRLALNIGMDMEANDFRFGIPLSYGTKIWQTRVGYYHVSSHMGDERALRLIESDVHDNSFDNRPSFNYNHTPYRINYYRETLYWSYAFRPTPNTRLYADVEYAVLTGEMTEPWHFQFGAEYSPRYPARGGWGTPFAAFNVRLLQEHDFDGNLNVQTGWQWRGSNNQLFRIGLQYFAGVSEQYEFIASKREHKIGIGVWYDF